MPRRMLALLAGLVTIPASLGAQDFYALCWELFELSPEKVALSLRAQSPTP